MLIHLHALSASAHMPLSFSYKRRLCHLRRQPVALLIHPTWCGAMRTFLILAAVFGLSYGLIEFEELNHLEPVTTGQLLTNGSFDCVIFINDLTSINDQQATDLAPITSAIAEYVKVRVVIKEVPFGKKLFISNRVYFLLGRTKNFVWSCGSLFGAPK